MTFQPVVLPAVLIVIAVAVIVMRLITMWQLMKSSTRWATVWRWSGLTFVALLILLAAARPGIEPVEQQAAAAKQSGTNTNVFLIVDRSADSGIDDFGDGQSRMSGIRADIAALIDRYPQARFAVIAFASRPSLDWPLSDDSWTLEPVIERLYPYDESPDGQVNAAAAANVLRYQLIAAGQQYPDSENLVFYFGSGAAGSRAPQGEFDPLPDSVDGGAVLGYGATLNEPGLRRIAEQLGVSYAHREPGQPLTQAVPNPGTAAEPAETATASSGVVARTELYWVFTALAAVLLLFEIYLTVREFRRTRMAHRDVTL
jgi:Ca-activated chloride channel homolog